jgi:DNA-binding NarL/FixJ family response regulator
MEEQTHRILVVSVRLLVAQSIVSLLEGAPRIEQVAVVTNLYDALSYCEQHAPDTLVIDLPSGADYFVDRPVTVEGREIKTIVLLEEDHTGQAYLYVHTPRRAANLQNLLSAILLDGERYVETPSALADLSALIDNPPSRTDAGLQPTSFIKARASGPNRSRISISNTEL